MLCSCSRRWKKTDEQQFTGGCLHGAFKEMDSAKAKSYCDCMLQQLKKRYPNPADLRYIKADTAMFSLGKQCRE
jgi:hypothetical protein